MKTTIDLPDDLILEMKLRAVRKNRKLKDLAADLIRSALFPRKLIESESVNSLPRTLPIMQARPSPEKRPATAMTPQQMSDWVKEADLRLEADPWAP